MTKTASRSRVRCWVTPCAAVAVSIWLSVAAFAQGSPADTVPADSDLTVTGAAISATSDVSDRDIRVAIQKTIGSFPSLASESIDVGVNNGVVVLRGTVQDDDQRKLVQSLAKNGDGVVAVDNGLELVQAPIWTIEPAFVEIRKLLQDLVRTTPLVLLGLFVLIAFVVGARWTVKALRVPLSKRITSTLVRNVIENVLFALSLVIGVYLFLRISGLTRLAVTLAGGTGLVGLIVGFAFRDIAENFLASILISVQRPFRIGDTIEVTGHVGIVQRVTTRGTVLMDFDGNHIQLSNSTVYKNTIRNLTANPKLRINFLLGIGYDSAVTHAQKVALEILREHSAVLDDPEPLVLVEELGAATINLRIYFWIDSEQYSKAKVQSSLMRLIVRAFEAAEISLPDEAREVVFPQPVPVQMIESAAVMPSLTQKEVHASEESDEATDAEGGLTSEVEDIEEQAKSARNPEGGADILNEESASADLPSD